jgi:hypothetical protein
MLSGHDLAFGTGEHRRTPRYRHERSGRGSESDDISELGHEAIKGVTTVATVGIAASMMGGILGGFGK